MIMVSPVNLKMIIKSVVLRQAKGKLDTRAAIPVLLVLLVSDVAGVV